MKRSGKKLAALIGAVVVGLGASTAFAAGNFNLQTVILMSGDCELQAAGDASPCKGTVMWSEFKHGRTMLSFYRNKSSFTVSGDTSDPPASGDYLQPIDTMRFFDGDKLLNEDEGAKGECRLDKKARTLKCEVTNPREKIRYTFALNNVHVAKKWDY